jgi:hypothetical protein
MQSSEMRESVANIITIVLSIVKLVSAPPMVFKKYFNSFYREGK